MDLRTRHVKADLLIPSPEPELEIWPSVNPEVGRYGEYVFFDISYNIRVVDAKKRDAIELHATFSLVFQILDEKVSDEDLSAFGAIGAISVAHPYARELFQNLTGRMGVPPLVLDVLPPEPAEE
ncbi:protein-export chaperone SecB [Micromonospora phytophila]|uniref:protein-export chaperone SecB n=1 Tax=Micromonospora phytophila TaxID=709888 RepID=UPI002030C96D|nr:protein-export chaperone SecB [Micromonospora phytophila]MCM0675088.1 protein-export chaperone SecB [Micromonospora phytophila]